MCDRRRLDSRRSESDSLSLASEFLRNTSNRRNIRRRGSDRLESGDLLEFGGRHPDFGHGMNDDDNDDCGSGFAFHESVGFGAAGIDGCAGDEK